MSPVYWAMVLTIFKPGSPGDTFSDITGVHYTNEAACIASALKEQPAGAQHTPDGRWIIYTCVKVDPEAYIMIQDGQHITFKPGTKPENNRKAACAIAREQGDKAFLHENCPEARD